MSMKPHMFHLADEDMEAIAKIKEMYGNMSDGAAVRLALRLVTKKRTRKKKEETNK